MSEVCKHLTTSSSIWIALEHSNAIEVLCTFHGHTHETWELCDVKASIEARSKCTTGLKIYESQKHHRDSTHTHTPGSNQALQNQSGRYDLDRWMGDFSSLWDMHSHTVRNPFEHQQWGCPSLLLLERTFPTSVGSVDNLTLRTPWREMPRPECS